MIASLIFFITKFLWRYSGRLKYLVTSYTYSCFFALISSFLYTAIAGFSIPTTRAFIMVSIVLLYIILKRYIHYWNIFSIAIISILVIEPFATLRVGFWLSFSAVFIILYTLDKYKNKSFIWQLIIVQFIIFLGLIPIGIFFFQKLSLISPVANMLAVPLFSFIVIPFSLLASALFFILPTNIANYIFLLVDNVLSWIFNFLELLSNLSINKISIPVFSNYEIIFTVIALLIIMSPKFIPKKISLIFLLPMLLHTTAKMPGKNYKLTVFDVGQGLAIMVETKHHYLLYDTGFKSSNSFDTGDKVINPYLKANNIKLLDKVIISHYDIDHRGGFQSINSNYTIKQIITSNTNKIKNSNLCQYGDKWIWDGIVFSIIHPNKKWLKKKYSENNNSCVLKIDNGNNVTIVAGDIEKETEKYLLEKHPSILDADILLVPHHGSLTSSSEQFIKKVSPKIAIISSGFKNRFNLPHLEVLDRYKNNNIKTLDTKCSGAIELIISNIIKIEQLRKEKNFFYNRKC